MRSLTPFVALLACLAFVPLTAMANDWIAAGSDNLWSNPDNWSQGLVPVDSKTDPGAGWDDPAGPFYPLTPDDPTDDFPAWNNNAMLVAADATILIDSSVHATAFGVRIGVAGATNTLEMTGGRLDIGIDPDLDPSENAVGWHLDVGRGFNQSGNPDPTATMLMSGGTVVTNGLLIPEGFVDESLVEPYDTPGLNGELIMTGGTINARWMNVGQFTGNGNAVLSGDAVINLASNVQGDPNNGGYLVMKRNWYILGQPVETVADAHLDISGNAIISIHGNISELESAPDQDEVDRYQGYVDDGWLTANDGTDEPTIFLGDGMIKICALAADFDSDCDVDAEDQVLWEAGFGTVDTALKMDGDADNDQDVDGDDFLQWQLAHGVGVVPESSVAASGAVPEPTSIWLLVSCGAILSLRRQRIGTRPGGM